MTTQKTRWTERSFNFELPNGMLPFYLERLTGTIVRLETKFKNVAEEVLSNKLDGKWSVKQNIGHLSEVDDVSLIRIDEILRGISPISSAVFETKKDYNTMTLDVVLKYFTESRVKNIERLKALTDEELQKSSLHPRLQVQVSPIGLAWFHAEHDDHHIVRMNEIISTLLK